MSASLEHASMWCWSSGTPAMGNSGWGTSSDRGRNLVPGSWNGEMVHYMDTDARRPHLWGTGIHNAKAEESTTASMRQIIIGVGELTWQPSLLKIDPPK